MAFEEKLQKALYTRYPIVALAWPSGCISRVQTRAKLTCIQQKAIIEGKN